MIFPTKVCQCCAGTGFVPDMLAVADILRKARRDAGLSLREVARRVGVSAPYMWDLERGGRKLNADLINRIEAALKKEVSNG